MWNKQEIQRDFKKFVKKMGLSEWNITLEFVEHDWKNTGNIKVDADDKSAIVYLNIFNPKNDNYEQVLIHELCHLKLWKLDQYCESLLDVTFPNKQSKEYAFGYNQFMSALEPTVQEIAQTYIALLAKNKKLSFVRCQQRMPFKEPVENQ